MPNSAIVTRFLVPIGTFFLAFCGPCALCSLLGAVPAQTGGAIAAIGLTTAIITLPFAISWRKRRLFAKAIV